MNRQVLNYMAPDIDPNSDIWYPEAIEASKDLRWNAAERRVLAKIAEGGDDVTHEHFGSGRIVRVAGERICFIFHEAAHGTTNIYRSK